ncbi:hypothetical protein D3C85_1344680 [compost metagenome]
MAWQLHLPTRNGPGSLKGQVTLIAKHQLVQAGIIQAAADSHLLVAAQVEQDVGWRHLGAIAIQISEGVHIGFEYRGAAGLRQRCTYILVGAEHDRQRQAHGGDLPAVMTRVIAVEQLLGQLEIQLALAEIGLYISPGFSCHELSLLEQFAQRNGLGQFQPPLIAIEEIALQAQQVEQH